MSLFDSARFRLSVSRLDGLPPGDVPEIAFAGRSNAGKSTTINVLTRQGRLAFASKTPGRTQLINFFDLSQKNEIGHRERVASLVDLPGYGFAKAAEDTRKTWSELIGGYLASRDTLTGIVVVMDARRPFMPPFLCGARRSLHKQAYRARRAPPQVFPRMPSFYEERLSPLHSSGRAWRCAPP